MDDDDGTAEPGRTNARRTRLTWPAGLSDRTLPVAAALGLGVGLAVFAFERSVLFFLERVRAAPVGVMVLAPGIGLVMAALALRLGPTGAG